jgi:hypothetical protein
MTIGGYRVDRFAKGGLNETNIKWSGLSKNTNYWTLELESITMDGQGMVKNTTNIVIDTGMSFSIIPVEDFKTITQLLYSKHGVTYFFESTNYAGFFGAMIEKEEYERLPEINLNIR